jgi:hypothetical protein
MYLLFTHRVEEVSLEFEEPWVSSIWKGKVGIKEPLVLGIWKTSKNSAGFMKEQAKNHGFLCHLKLQRS